MEIAVFKVKSRILWSFKIQYLELQKSNWCKLNCFGFLTQRPTNALNFSEKRCYMRDIWVFKDDNWILPANRFREETNPNYIPKHPNRHPSFYFSNLAPLVDQSRRSRKATTKLKPPTTNQLPATSRQPPSHYHHLLMFTLELWFFLLTIYV